MRPAFLGMDIARSALFASQQQLDLTSHNIANASVDGYSRQRLNLQAAPDIYNLGAYPGAVGEGVWATQVQRLRDSLLDRDYYRQNQQLTGAQTQSQYLGRLETAMGELGDNGIQTSLEKFFDAWQSLSQNPEDLSQRQALLGQAQQLAEQLRNTDRDTLALQADIQTDLSATVQRVNEISHQLAALNPEILKRSGAGDTPSDLLDQRDRLLDELSGYAAIQVAEDEHGVIQVQIDGKAIVVNDQAYDIKLQPEADILRAGTAIGFPVTLNRGDVVINGVDLIGSGAPLAINSAADYGRLIDQINGLSAQTQIQASLDPAGKLVLQGQRDGTTYLSLQLSGAGVLATGLTSGDSTLTSRVSLQLRTGTYLNSLGGKLGGLMNVRNQQIPATLTNMHQLTADLIRRVNTVHSAAYNLNRTNGQAFFTGTSPGDIEVAASLLADPSRVAVAGSANFPPGDGSQALAIYNLRGQMKLDERYRTLVTDLGTRIAQLNETQAQRQLVVDQLNTQRQSVSGVNLDEELSKMLQYQRSFSAAARIMNTLDEMTNQIVNGLGAGR